MKPYFAKYLPVEGEIKEGDLVFKHDCIPKIYKHVPTTNPWYKDEKKVKLFLCSRDIQVGDEVYQITKTPDTYGLNKFIIKEISDPKVKTHGGYGIKQSLGEAIVLGEDIRVHKDSCFKIIGEILTEGIKEGQEFTEKELEFLTIGK